MGPEEDFHHPFVPFPVEVSTPCPAPSGPKGPEGGDSLQYHGGNSAGSDAPASIAEEPTVPGDTVAELTTLGKRRHIMEKQAADKRRRSEVLARVRTNAMALHTARRGIKRAYIELAPGETLMSPSMRVTRG